MLSFSANMRDRHYHVKRMSHLFSLYSYLTIIQSQVGFILQCSRSVRLCYCESLPSRSEFEHFSFKPILPSRSPAGRSILASAYGGVHEGQRDLHRFSESSIERCEACSASERGDAQQDYLRHPSHALREWLRKSDFTYAWVRAIPTPDGSSTVSSQPERHHRPAISSAGSRLACFQ